MKRRIFLTVGLLLSLIGIIYLTAITISWQRKIPPLNLLASQQQGSLTFPSTLPLNNALSPQPAESPTITPVAANTDTPVSTTPLPTATTTPVPLTSTPSPQITEPPIGQLQTRQADWVYNGSGVCWSAWAGQQCSLQAHEGGATSVARDLDHDGTVDITCSQNNQTNHSTTVTNTSNKSITLACERYQCNSCMSGNGTHAQCDGALDPSSERISEQVEIKPGCSLTCTFSGIVGSCDLTPQPTVSVTPTNTLPSPSLSLSPTVTVTSMPIPTPTIGDSSPSPSTGMTISPPVEAIKAMVSSVSSENIRSHIQNLIDDDENPGTDEIQTRFAGSSGNKTEAEYIKTQLSNFGWKITEQKFNKVDSILSGFACPSDFEMNNIIGRLEGTGQDTYMFTGHYDSISEEQDYDPAPGGDDNATGTSAILETARVLGESYKQKQFINSIEIVLFDGEELGLCGSSYYVSQLDETRKNAIKGVVNIDMIGYTPFPETCSAALYSNTDIRSKKLVEQMAATNNTYGIKTTGLAYATTRKDSDHASFWHINIPAFLIIECYPEQNPNYHRTSDTLSYLNIPQIHMAAQSVTALMGELALAVPPSEPSGSVPTPTSTGTDQISPSIPTPTIQSSVFPSPSPSAGTNRQPELETEIFRLINETRKNDGLGELSLNTELSKEAELLTEDLAVNLSTPCGHFGTDGSSIIDRLKKTDYNGQPLFEIVACGSRDPQDALQGWLNSPGHRNAMMNPFSNEMGVSVSMGKYSYTVYAVAFGIK